MQGINKENVVAGTFKRKDHRVRRDRRQILGDQNIMKDNGEATYSTLTFRHTPNQVIEKHQNISTKPN